MRLSRTQGANSAAPSDRAPRIAHKYDAGDVRAPNQYAHG
jgi:hypothetical protein